MRGHGESDKPSGPYPIAAYAGDLAYIIEQLGISKTVAIGHSMGGMAVLQLAAAHPDCVGAIVMVDSTLVYSPDRHTAVRRWRTASRPAITAPAGSGSKARSYQTPTGNSWRR
jgi:3-oxoadipate enol-lactonase